MNFEVKCLLNFQDIWKKNIKKEPSDLNKKEKIVKITQVDRKISIQEKKVKDKCACCFGSKFVL